MCSTKDLSNCTAWASTFATQPPQIKHSIFQKHSCEEDVVLVKEGVLMNSEETSSSCLTWNLYCVCDGHGGKEAAEYIKNHFWKVLHPLLPITIPDNSSNYSTWAKAIRAAIKKAFLAIECDFYLAHNGNCAGSTMTVALVCGWLLTVANIGDTEALVDTGNSIEIMTQTHRLEESPDECARLKIAGVNLARLCADLSGPALDGSEGLGPKRCWPGGLANARSIGDSYGGKHILSSPHVKQCVLPNTGCRLVIGSDGLWDSLNASTVCYLSRSVSNSMAAERLVTRALFRNDWIIEDDTTALVVDFLPDANTEFHQFFKSLKKRNRKMKKLFSCFCASAHKDLVDANNSNTNKHPKAKLIQVSNVDSHLIQDDEAPETIKIEATTHSYEDSSSEISNSAPIEVS